MNQLGLSPKTPPNSANADRTLRKLFNNNRVKIYSRGCLQKYKLRRPKSTFFENLFLFFLLDTYKKLIVTEILCHA